MASNSLTSTEVSADAALIQCSLDGLDIGLCVYDASLRLALYNRRFLSLLDLPRGLVRIGVSLEDMVRFSAGRGDYGPGSAEDVTRRRLEMARSGEPHSFERRREDGTIIDVRCKPVEGGGLITTYTDITRRRRAEESLRRSEERFRSIAQSATDAIIVIDGRGNVLSWNDGASQVFGYAAEEMIGQPVALVIPQRYRSAHQAGLARQPKGSKGSRIIGRMVEVQGLHKDGHDIPVEISIGHWQVGDETYYSGIIRDISERKKAEDALRRAYDDLELKVHEHTHHLQQEITERRYTEEALRASEEKYRATINSTSEGYWAIDPISGATLEVNDSLCHMLGYERGDIVGKPPMAFADAATQRMLRDSWRNIPYTEQWRYEIVLKAKDGRDVYALVNATSVLGPEGKPERVFAFLTDISERRAQEERLALSESEARVARREAELANRAKSDFLSSMSHELRTPMNAILGFGQLLQYNPKESLSVTQHDYVDQILKAGHHLLELINEVLDLSKIEAGKVDLTIEDVSPRKVFKECLVLTRVAAERRGVRIIEPDCSGEPPPVRADHTRFKQALLNLLSNAVKYNHEGGTVALNCSVLSSGFLRIAVRDTGPGIPEDKHGQLFEAFSRLGAEATDVEGTGIGLTITRRLVELMDGSVGFESRVGQGSTFWIDLPVAPFEPVDMPSGTIVPCTIHYWEDNPASLRLMEEILGQLPNAVMLSAHSVERGLELIQSRHPDVIVIDMDLHGVSGFEILTILRGQGYVLPVPVIALVGDLHPRRRAQGLDAGFHEILIKPVKVDQVLGAISSALAGSRTTGHAVPADASTTGTEK